MGQAVAAILVFAGASFFFALAETALFSLGKWQVAQLAEKKPRAGKIVAALLEHPQDLLATLAARMRAQPEKFKLRKTLQPSFCPHAPPVSAKAAQF
jgi:cytochrome oxidase assembly protein ShyY1